MSGTTYQPRYRVTGTTAWINFGSPVSGPPVTFTGLNPDTPYDFDLLAINNFGTTDAAAFVTDATTDQIGNPLDGFVAGHQATVSTDPAVAGPQKASVIQAQTLAVTGVTIASALAGSTSACTLSLSCGQGTLSITAANVSGNGTASLSVAGTVPALQAALLTLRYTAPAPAGSDTIAVALTNPAAVRSSISIAVAIDPGAPPSAVTSLAPSNPTASSVSLGWGVPLEGSAPLSYQPAYRVSGAGSWTLFGGAIQTTSITITGLTGATPYDFRVTAINAAGTFDSDPVTQSTAVLSGVPPSAP